MMKGTHETPASVKQIFSFGNRTGTPVVTMLIRFAIIANVCATVCRASAVSNCSTLKGNTGKTAETLCSMTGRPAASATA